MKIPEWYVGQEVVVVLSTGGRLNVKAKTVKGTVTKVARVNVTVEYSPYGGSSTEQTPFRIEDGWENTPYSRTYSQHASRIYSVEGWEERQAQNEQASRVRLHNLGGMGSQWARASASDLQRLADLLDEIYGKPEPK